MRHRSWIVRHRAASTSISPDRDHVYTFDLEGRPVSWYEKGRVYKRALDGAIHGRRRRHGRRVHWKLEPGPARTRLASVLDCARRAPLPAGSAGDEPAARLERIAAWSPEALIAERARYERAYRPVTILPPDQYLAIVLQATEGCSWNRCTFCSFYQDRPFRARSLEEFGAHLENVSRLLGRGAALRRSVFLADGNALMLSLQRLVPMIEAARLVFPGRWIGGFIDLVSGERRAPDDWRVLARLGLERVSIGLETGDADLLSSLNKPGSPADAIPFVETLKRASLAVNLIFLVGIGGSRRALEHRRRTVGLAARLPLDERDVIYLSPYLPAGSDPTAPLPEWLASEYGALRDDLRRARPGVRVTRYDIREFVY